jgi:outer membrane lipoprotein-sorting protein
MADDRDELLGAALARLAVPPHRAGFPDEVWALVDTLSTRGDALGGRRRRRVFAMAAVAAAAAAAAIVLVLTGVPGLHRSAPATATAQEVAARMSGSLRSLQGLRGSYVSDWGEGRSVGTFVVDAEGSARWDTKVAHVDDVGGRSRSVTIYNATEHEVLDYLWDKTTGGTRRTGTRRTPTPTELASSGLPFRSMAGLVRAALASGDPDIRIEDTVFEGRSAWQAFFTGRAFRDSLRGVDVTVDKSTGALLRYRHRAEPHREPAWTYTVTHLQVDPALPEALFTTATPSGFAIRDLTSDAFCSLTEAEARTGLLPLLASATPSGFRLVASATFPRVSNEQNFFFAAWPTSRSDPDTEVMLQYRLGLDSYTILQAPVSERDRVVLARQDKRLARVPTCRSDVLESGAFAGEHARTWFTTAGSFLQVHSASRCVRISGDLTRQELLAVAASLVPAQE